MKTKTIKVLTSSSTVSFFLGLVLLASVLTQQQSVYGAALKSQSAIPSNNIVSTISTFEILFTTATTGTIQSIEIVFPSGYDVAGAKVIERIGIGVGTITGLGNSLIYIVNSPVNIPLNTPMRFEISNIINTVTAGSASVTITTKNTEGDVVDGPTAAAVPLRQITTTDIADNAVSNLKLGDNAVTSPRIADGSIETHDLDDSVLTSTKVNSSLMHTKILSDSICDVDYFGWCPDGQHMTFGIRDPQIPGNAATTVIINFDDHVSQYPGESDSLGCDVMAIYVGQFQFACERPIVV